MVEIDLGKVVGNDGSGGQMEIDAELSDVSTNPVQNKVVKKAIDEIKALVGEAETILREV